MSTIKVDAITTRTGSGNITVSNNIAGSGTISGTNITASGTLGVTGNTTMGGTAAITGNTTVGGTLVNTGLITASAGVAIGGTGAANTLDDYEEGTWTPVFYSGGVVGGTYASQYGTYTKIGRQVFVNFGIQNNSMSGSTLLRLGGLPFSMSSAVNGGGASSVLAQGFDSVGLESYQGSDNQVFYDIKNGGYLTHGGGQSKKIQGNFTYIA